MKKRFTLCLAVLFCLFSLCACSREGEKKAELGFKEQIELIIDQLGTPSEDAYRNLHLPGEPEDGIDSSMAGADYLWVREGIEFLGKPVGSIGLGHIGALAPGQTLLTVPVGWVSCGFELKQDQVDYVLTLYNALKEAYGDAIEPEAADSSQVSEEDPSQALPFSTATTEAIWGMGENAYYTALWRVHGQEVNLSANLGASQDGSGQAVHASLEIRYPQYLYRMAFSEDGKFLGWGPSAYNANNPVLENEP